MPLALLVTLVSVTLSAGLSGLVVGQIQDSRRVADRVAAVNAAQAGLDAGLATIRAAFDNDGGLLSKLPCVPMTGSMNTASTYSTSVGYFTIDPSNSIRTLGPIGDLTNINKLIGPGVTAPLADLVGQLGAAVTTTVDLTGLNDTLDSAIACVADSGKQVIKQVPLYGLLRSVGKVNGVSRTLYATYKFRNVNETIPGGRLVIAGTGNKLCFGDLKPAPVNNDVVSAVLCVSDDKQAKFIYPKNISLQLSQSRTSTATGANAYPYGLCVTAPLILAEKGKVTFTKCSPTSTLSQQWDYDVNQQTYYAGEINKTTLLAQRSRFCLSMDTPNTAPGSPIVLRSGTGNCGKANVLGKSFVPEATVGAGGAGPDSEQYVNKDEVGRCLDLTNEDPAGGWAKTLGISPALISYPCKQTFSGNVYWNHQWIGPLTPQMIKDNITKANGQVYVVQPTTPAKNWCMRSPGAAGGPVWVALCSPADPNQQWTVYGPRTLTSEAYQVVDKFGNCMEAAGSRGGAYLFNAKFSFVYAFPCTGKPEQKWNAPTELPPGPLKSIQEN